MKQEDAFTYLLIALGSALVITAGVLEYLILFNDQKKKEKELED